MAKLRIRLKLNEGGEGAPLDQLVGVAQEAERFLRMLADDLGISTPKGEWLARNFTNQSVAFDSEHPAEYPITQIAKFNAAFALVADFDRAPHRLNGEIKHRTLLQYARIPDAIGPHEKVSFGLYRAEDAEPFEWKPLSKRDALTLRDRLTEEVTYTGSVHGRVHDFVVETPRSFRLRLKRTAGLVRCQLANDELYETLLASLDDPDALIYVHGQITARRVDRAIERVVAHRLRPAPKLSAADYERFFGMAAGYTGALTTEEFIDQARSYEH